MTRSDIAKLSDEEAEIIMAQLLEFTDVRKANEPSSLLSGIPSKSDHANHREVIPSYCSDLNAVAEVENTLKGAEQANYFNVLASIADQYDRDHPENKRSTLTMICATARLRVEALLATMGQGSETDAGLTVVDDGTKKKVKP